MKQYKYNFITNCSSNDPFQGCADIEITVPTLWQNTTINMCYGQKIIIQSSGSLTLSNVTITRMPSTPSTNCPDLYPVNLWDGIQIMGTSQINNIQLGSLSVTNNSVIEYSLNGINSTSGFGKIEIINSTIQLSDKLLDVNDSWPFSLENEIIEEGYTSIQSPSLCGSSTLNTNPEVTIINSNLFLDHLNTLTIPTSQFPQIGLSLSGVKCTINKSNIYNNSNTTSTGIVSERGNLKVINGSRIEEFSIGIKKLKDL